MSGSGTFEGATTSMNAPSLALTVFGGQNEQSCTVFKAGVNSPQAIN